MTMINGEANLLDILDRCYRVARRPVIWNTLAHGGVYYAENGEGNARHSEAMGRAVKTGRVFDIGTLPYEASKQASEIGLSLWHRVGFRWPFHAPFVIVGEVSYKPDREPETLVVIADPDPDNENVIRLSECSVMKGKHLVCWHICETVVGEKFRVLSEFGGNELRDHFGWKDTWANHVVPYNTVFALLAICNTRGVPMRSFPKTKNAPVARTEFSTGPYFSALGPSAEKKAPTGTHRSPVPHIRRGHLRKYRDGRTVWIRDMLVGVRTEDELSFAERRVAYKLSEGGYNEQRSSTGQRSEGVSAH